MRESVLELYKILSEINSTLSAPLMQISKDLNIRLVSVFLIGILGATAPCQLSTNLGAIGYLTNRSIDRGKLRVNTLWYTLGRIITYLIFGLIIIGFKINFQQRFLHVFSFTRKLVGPIIIIVGLNLIGLLKFKFSLGSRITENIERYSMKFEVLNPAFILGVFFSFAFCPTLFWLFFGMAVPLALQSPFGIVFPAIFAVGTLIPMLIAVIIIGTSKGNNKNIIRKFKKFQGIIRVLGGVVITIFGLIDMVVYFFI